ncbi:MAG TPA: glucokinase, partial [Candidatus Limnocylindrales bacterium]|nr:glucokinase [Candidatus Limnocylindrales bacterium]
GKGHVPGRRAGFLARDPEGQGGKAMILAGDAGGTKTYLALFSPQGASLARGDVRSYPSREFPSLESILKEFLGNRRDVNLACIGVAGPVRSGRSRLTNLPWLVEEESIRRACGARRGFLINDLQATAFAVPFLEPERFAVLQEGEADPEGAVAVVAAGTGLGVAFLVRSGRDRLPFPSEGGHADFAPRDEREVRLLEYLRSRFGRVSVERAVSGPGLHALYRFLREVEGIPEVPEVDARLACEDPPRAIAEEGLAGRSAACREALHLFVSLYGALAGNFALQFFATGGVVLGGGIAPAILPMLSEGTFLDAFRAKGRFREFLSELPVKVVLDDRAALLGAAHYAMAREGGEG